MKKISIKLLEEKDIPSIVDAFKKADWKKPTSLFEQYLKEQQNNQRTSWVACLENHIAGYITLKWQSEYQDFLTNNIPEIKDLNVLPEYRNLGIGNKLLETAEAMAKEKSNVIGIAVGLHKSYGAAQKLYIKHGYVPDGEGLTYNSKPVEFGESVIVDDDLVLWLTKKI